MSTLTQFGGGNAVGSIVPGIYPGNSRYLTCDGVSTTPVTSANSSLAKIFPSVTSGSPSHITSNFTGFNPYGIAYGAGVWVVVGSGASGGTETDISYCLTSTDLVNWMPRPMPSNCIWRSVTWTGSRFVAVGSDSGATTGYAAYSTDGVTTWANSGIPSAVMYRWVLSVGGRIWAFGNAGSASYYTDDPAAWVNGGNTSIGATFAAAFKGRVFIHNTGSIYAKIGGQALTSAWTSVGSGLTLTGMASNNNTLVIASSTAGNTLTTTDGVTFTAQATAPALYSVVWDGTNFIGFGATSVYSSPTGVTWTLKSTDIYLTTTTRMLGTTDGTNTAFVDTSGAPPYVMTTTNSGTTIVQRPLPKSTLYNNGNYAPMAYSSTLGLYVMGGMSDSSYERTPMILTSPDGNVWTERALELPAFGTLANGSIQQIVWTGTAFIASNSASATVVHVSTDGVNWRYRAAGSGGTAFLVYGASKAVLVYPSGVVYTSTDNGNTWQNQTAVGMSGIIGAAYNGTNFVVMSSSGAVYTSATATGTWTAQSGSGSNTYVNLGVVGTALVATVSGASSSIYYNTANGTGSWTTRSLPGSLTSAKISSDGTTMVLSTAGTATLFYSFTNPAGTITTVTLPRQITTSNSATCLIANGNLFVHSSNLSYGTYANGTVLVSTNGGTSWVERHLYAGWNLLATNFSTNPTSSTIFGGKTYFVTRNKNQVWTFEDNNTSIRTRLLPIGLGPTSPIPNYTVIASNGTLMVALAYDANNIKTVISTSTDGTNWTLRTTPAALPSTVALGAPTVWTNLIWNGSVFLATSNSHVSMTSSDGITWTVQNMPVQEVVSGGCAWGAGNFFVSGAMPANNTSTLGYIGYYTSTDGVTWTARTSPVKYQASSTGAFFASDGTTVMMMPYSQTNSTGGIQYFLTTDGTTWTRGQAGGFGSALTNATQIVTAGSTFFAGNMASLDGKYWFSIGSTVGYPIPLSSTSVAGFNNSAVFTVATIDTSTIKSPALNSTATTNAPYYALSLVVA